MSDEMNATPEVTPPAPQLPPAPAPTADEVIAQLRARVAYLEDQIGAVHAMLERHTEQTETHIGELVAHQGALYQAVVFLAHAAGISSDELHERMSR